MERPQRRAFSPERGLRLMRDRLQRALTELKIDLPVAEFLERHFADQQYSELRRDITRMVGVMTQPTSKASTFALRDEWLAGPVARAGLPGDTARSSPFVSRVPQRKASRSVSARQ